MTIPYLNYLVTLNNINNSYHFFDNILYLSFFIVYLCNYLKWIKKEYEKIKRISKHENGLT